MVRSRCDPCFVPQERSGLFCLVPRQTVDDAAAALSLRGADKVSEGRQGRGLTRLGATARGLWEHSQRQVGAEERQGELAGGASDPERGEDVVGDGSRGRGGQGGDRDLKKLVFEEEEEEKEVSFSSPLFLHLARLRLFFFSKKKKTEEEQE